MNKKLAIVNHVLWIVCTSIVLTLIVAPFIHQIDVAKYQLDTYSGRTIAQIESDMSHLVNYLWLWNRQPLHLDYFTMSQTGVIHFAEVKVFVDIIQVVWIVTTVGLIYSIKQHIFKEKYVCLLKQTAMSTYGMIATFALVGMVAFDELFVLFHKIVFRNDYWIFNRQTDPVIMILPQEFFMHGFFAILAFVLVIATLFLLWYRRYFKAYREIFKS